MLKSDEEVFLDDITLEQLEEKLNIQVITCQNEGKDFVEKIDILEGRLKMSDNRPIVAVVDRQT